MHIFGDSSVISTVEEGQRNRAVMTVYHTSNLVTALTLCLAIPDRRFVDTRALWIIVVPLGKPLGKPLGIPFDNPFDKPFERPFDMLLDLPLSFPFDLTVGLPFERLFTFGASLGRPFASTAIEELMGSNALLMLQEMG